MAYYGKVFKYEKNENFEGFVKSLGLPEEKATLFLKSKPQQKITKDGDNYILTLISVSTGERNLKFTAGVEFVEKIRDEVSAKSTITVDGNVVTHVQKFEMFDNRTITYKKEFSDNSMVETLTTSFWDGSAKRFFSA